MSPSPVRDQETHRHIQKDDNNFDEEDVAQRLQTCENVDKNARLRTCENVHKTVDVNVFTNVDTSAHAHAHVDADGSYMSSGTTSAHVDSFVVYAKSGAKSGPKIGGKYTEIRKQFQGVYAGISHKIGAKVARHEECRSVDQKEDNERTSLL
jgi:hypothetical protein